jgi:hypothetical protein
MRTLIRALTAVVFAVACGTPAVSRAATSPRQLNLRLSDLPRPGFTQFKNDLLGPDRLAGNRGYVLLSDEAFLRKAPRIVQLVTSAIELYATPAFARADYLHFAADPANGGPPFAVIPFPAVGVQRQAQRMADSTGGMWYLVRYWRGPYAVAMSFDGTRGTVAPQDLVRLARLVDRRIQAAG